MIAAAVTVFFGACTPPQPGPPGPEYPGNSSQALPYDPRSTINVHGAIERVDDPGGETVSQLPVIVLVRSEEHTVRVTLAPRWYLDRERLTLAPGDIVDIFGTHAADQAGNSVVHARELRKGQERFFLDGGNHNPSESVPAR
jgi:hypothetical protein